MKDFNKVILTGVIYGEIKSGQGKNGTWASAKLKVQGEKYYQLVPLSAYGSPADALSRFSKDEEVDVEGEFEQAYQKEKTDFPRYQVKVTSIVARNSRGSNPEIDDIDLTF